MRMNAGALLSIALLALVGWAFPGSGLAADEPTGPSLKSLSDWDKAAEFFRQAAWSMHEASDRIGRDVRGRTMAEDTDTYVMPEAALSRLTALRATAEQQKANGDETSLSSTLAQAEAIFKEETVRSASVSMYWKLFIAIAHHEYLLQPLLLKASADRRGPVEKMIADARKALAEALAKQIAAVPDPAILEKQASPIRREFSKHAKAFNAIRIDLASAVRRDKPGEDPGGLSRERESACGSPAATHSAKDIPTVLGMRETLDRFYPARAMQDEVEGAVIMRLTISATGCMERAEIIDTSGADELGPGALEAAEYIDFAPPQRDGKAVRGTMMLRQKFEMHND